MVRLAAGDPDLPQRHVTIPAAWGQTAADGLVALLGDPAPADGPITLACAAQSWIGRLARAAEAIDPDTPMCPCSTREDDRPGDPGPIRQLLLRHLPAQPAEPDQPPEREVVHRTEDDDPRSPLTYSRTGR